MRQQEINNTKPCVFCSNPAAWGKMDFMVSNIFVHNRKPIPPEACQRKKGDKTGSRFFYIVEGETTFHMKDGRNVIASKGDIVYLAIDVEYDSEWNTAYDAEYITFNCNMEDREGRELCFRKDLDILVKDTELRFLPIFRSMNHLYCKDSVNETLQLKSMFYDFLSGLSKVLVRENLEKQENTSVIYPGILYLRENYTKNIRMEDVARLCNVSEATFRRMFKEYCGISPVKYKNNLRMNHAKHLLESGLYTVSEVTEITNFTDISHFNKSFKQFWGCNPSDYIPR